MSLSQKRFDAGPLWVFNENISLDDFKHCVIDKESINYIKKANANNLYDQRFSVYGKVEKQPDGLSIFHVYFQPSVPSDCSKYTLKKLEDIFGKGNVVKAERELTGIVHDKTREIRIKKAKEKKDEKELRFLEKKPEYEVGLSFYFRYIKDSIKLDFLNRSAMNKSVLDLNNLGRYALFFEDFEYDSNRRVFCGRKYAYEFHLARSASKEILDIVMNETLKAIKSYKKSECDDSACASFVKDTYWEKNIRYNRENFAEKLLETIYVAAGLEKSEPGEFWTKLDDVEIILNAMQIAKENQIQLNLNKIPKKFTKFKTGITTLMYAAKKGNIELVMSLIENGALVQDCDNQDHNAIWYAKNENKKDVAEYLQTIFDLRDAIIREDISLIKRHLNTQVIDISKPIFGELTAVAMAATRSPTVLKTVINVLKENKEDFDAPLGHSQRTPLFIAAYQGNLENVLLFLQAGADPQKVLQCEQYHFIKCDKIKNLLESSLHPKILNNEISELILELLGLLNTYSLKGGYWDSIKKDLILKITEECLPHEECLTFLAPLIEQAKQIAAAVAGSQSYLSFFFKGSLTDKIDVLIEKIEDKYLPQYQSENLSLS